MRKNTCFGGGPIIIFFGNIFWLQLQQTVHLMEKTSFYFGDLNFANDTNFSSWHPALSLWALLQSPGGEVHAGGNPGKTPCGCVGIHHDVHVLHCLLNLHLSPLVCKTPWWWPAPENISHKPEAPCLGSWVWAVLVNLLDPDDILQQGSRLLGLHSLAVGPWAGDPWGVSQDHLPCDFQALLHHVVPGLRHRGDLAAALYPPSTPSSSVTAAPWRREAAGWWGPISWKESLCFNSFQLCDVTYFIVSNIIRICVWVFRWPGKDRRGERPNYNLLHVDSLHPNLACRPGLPTPLNVD